MPLSLEKFTFGVGDRFGHQAKAQLTAFERVRDAGAEIYPVWNKSNREHLIVGSRPESLRAAADSAVSELGWDEPYFVDADHITLETVDGFLDSSDFFTLDVASKIGKVADRSEIREFVDSHPELVGEIRIEGSSESFETGREEVERFAGKFLLAVREAGRIYRHIESSKGAGNFVTEISMDETDEPQSPIELLVILAAIADEKIPVQTIAPKFTGRFNKGVDYVGDISQFESEFTHDVAVINHAVSTYGLPENLKLSVHSGSDKFSIYGAIRNVLRRTGAGVHIKTAGTTWLEEVIGLAEAGGMGLALAKEIYARAFDQSEDLCAPYATVIDIDASKLPVPADVDEWDAADFLSALRHDASNPSFNSHFRQLLHVGFKVAAKLGARYTEALEEFEKTISMNVTENLLDRHMKPLFLS